MVKYKNFGSSSQHETMNNFSFHSHVSDHSTKTTRTGKSSKRSHTSSPSRSRMIEEDEYEYDYRDEGGSRFNFREVVRDEDETRFNSDIKEEAESLYDMVSQDGPADDHSMSACASYSFSATDTDNESIISNPEQPVISPRRAKLSYMGYVPMSPNTAAQMGAQRAEEEARNSENSETHRTRNSKNSDTVDTSNNNNSGHTAGAGTQTSGSTYPSIKIDDTSTSRRRRGFDEEEDERQDQEQERYQSEKQQAQHYAGSTSIVSISSSQAIPEEPLSPMQKRHIEQQEQLKRFQAENEKQKQMEQRNRDPNTAASASVADQDATVGTSVQSSVMPNSLGPSMKMMNQQRNGQQQYQQAQGQFNPLSPVPATPRSQAYTQDPSMGFISPLTATGVSVYANMAPPQLNHPSMHQPWNQQQQHGFQNQHHQQQGFFPRNPVLARQLQAFSQHHNNEQRQPPPQTPPPHHSFRPVQPAQQRLPSQQSSGDRTGSDHEPLLVCGPEGLQMMDNVKFVTPNPEPRNLDSGSISTMSRSYEAARYGGVNALNAGCGLKQIPAGQKCQSYVASFINTCGAIVTHGYHVDNRKRSAREKREKFRKVADKSINEVGKSDQDRGAAETNPIVTMGSNLNDAIQENAKKIFDAGNNMVNNLPKDFQNLTQSAAYQNVFDTFQKYAPMSPREENDGGALRAALNDDPDEIKGNKEQKQQSILYSPLVQRAQRAHGLKGYRRFATIKRTESEPNQAVPGSSPTSLSSKEKRLEASFENFKERYARNIHTKVAQERMQRAPGLEPEECRPDEPKTRSPTTNNANDPPNESKDDDSQCSWSTPVSQEGGSSSPEGGNKNPSSSKKETSKSKPITTDLEEVVQLSTSSGMSDSLVGSDVDEDSKSLDLSESSDEDEEHMLVNSFDQDFPHTHLDVIEEGSEDEETTTIAQLSTIASSDDLSVVTCESMLMEGTSTMRGIVRIMFVSMLLIQFGTAIAFWDQLEGHIRTMEGGPEMLAVKDEVVSSLRSSGESLVTTAKSLVEPANKLFADFKEDRKNSRAKQEMNKFRDLIDEALLDDDLFVPDEADDFEEEATVFTTETVYEDALETHEEL